MRRRVALTIGNFDGVHLGHRALVRSARAAIGDEGRVVVLGFDPHPATVLRPERMMTTLTTFDERTDRLREAGADEVVRLEPTHARLEQTPGQFLQEIVEAHEPSVIVEGSDFRFGRGRTGDVTTLRDAGARLGFACEVVEPVEVGLGDQSQVVVSSSIIRWMLKAGRVADAAAMLGRPHTLESLVVAGDKRGRTIGVPTANLASGVVAAPGDGIYAGRARGPDSVWYPAAISVGTKPTFGGHARVTETHLVGYRGPVDDYGWTIRLEFQHWLRGQIRYGSADLLVEQLRRDLVAAERLGARAAG